MEFDERLRLLEVAESYLRESVAPIASKIDLQPEVLRNALRGLGENSLLALQIAKSWGGMEVSDETYCHFLQLLARYSGTLAFLQIQHQGAGKLLAKGENEYLKQQYLPRMGNGQVLVGVGFSQLRRQGKPPLKAIPVTGGYQLQGKVPWLTGFGFFSKFIVGAVLPDGRELYGMLPFSESCQDGGGAIALSKPMQLAVMESTNTVSVTLTNWFLPDQCLVSIEPAGTIHSRDKKQVLDKAFLPLGCTRAAIEIIETTALSKQLDFARQAVDSFKEELSRCEREIIQALPPESSSWEEQLQLRAWAIDLAGRCSQAAVTVSSGAANYKHHPAQRVYREALMFTVFGQTTAVMESTLARLLH
ncbi:MAG: acyl-CoA dehydrogenase family protein, partial [Prochloraceae cyanobacterium]